MTDKDTEQEGDMMSAQPATTHDEQTTDPQVLARLKAALAEVDRAALRASIVRASRPSARVTPQD